MNLARPDLNRLQGQFPLEEHDFFFFVQIIFSSFKSFFLIIFCMHLYHILLINWSQKIWVVYVQYRFIYEQCGQGVLSKMFILAFCLTLTLSFITLLFQKLSNKILKVAPCFKRQLSIFTFLIFHRLKVRFKIVVTYYCKKAFAPLCFT